MSRTVAARPPREPKTPRQPGIAILPPRAERTQIQPAVAAGAAGKSFADDLAVFTAAMSKTPGALLAALSPDLVEPARRRAEELKAMTSQDRRAQVATTFAPKHDIGLRLHAVIAEAGPLLRAEIYSQLPPWLRLNVGDLVRSGPTQAVPPLVKKLAARLIRECTR